MLDSGKTPRPERQQQAEKPAAKAAATAQALTVGEVWPLYLENGKPKRRDAWKPVTVPTFEAMAAPGGEKEKPRGQGTTRPGPLYPLLALPLAGVNEDTLKSWYDREAVAGKHQAARALMMFRVSCAGVLPARVSEPDRPRCRQGRRHRESFPATPAELTPWKLPRFRAGGLAWSN